MNILRLRNGYTLIEVMVASAIFLIAVLAVSALLLQGYKAMGMAGNRSINLHVTQEEIEAAIADQGYIPENEDVRIIRDNVELIVFGNQVGGTLVTVTRTIPGQNGNEVTYTYFVPGDGE